MGRVGMGMGPSQLVGLDGLHFCFSGPQVAQDVPVAARSHTPRRARSLEQGFPKRQPSPSAAMVLAWVGALALAQATRLVDVLQRNNLASFKVL